MKLLAQLKRPPLMQTKISFLVLSIESNGVWRTTNHLAKTGIDERKISFAHDSYVIVDLPQGGKGSISCAIATLPEILQDLSNLKKPEQVLDVKKQLPSILESLSETTSRARDNEHEIYLMQDSLAQQTEILHDRKVQLEEETEVLHEREVDLDQKVEEHRKKIAEDKQEMKTYSDRIRRDQFALEAQLVTYKTNRAELSQSIQQMKLEKERLQGENNE